ncbi:MAG: hypothetical protein FWE38_00055 [Firmicutes bacterium]|nr:hypothetical protein [Bacillota bacterium]
MYYETTNNWTFGTLELISLIAAVLTFSAICVSLWLATKSKTLRYRLFQKKINKVFLKENELQRIIILNTGHIKFTLSMVGYKIGKSFYFCKFNRYQKKHEHPVVSIRPNGGKHTDIMQDCILPVFAHEGDCVEMVLFPKDFDFKNTNKNKKVFYFIVINGKTRVFNSGMRENEFYEIVANLTQKSLHYKQGDENARDLNDIIFRN